MSTPEHHDLDIRLLRTKRNANRPMRGALVGAAVGLVARGLVAISFTYYEFNWGSMREENGLSLSDLVNPGKSEVWKVFAISMGIGVLSGGAGGVTCRPKLGAAIGALVSAMNCVILVILPVHVALALGEAQAHKAADSGALKFQVEIAVGLLAMTMAGALAGGIGAAVGGPTCYRGVTQPSSSH